MLTLSDIVTMAPTAAVSTSAEASAPASTAAAPPIQSSAASKNSATRACAALAVLRSTVANAAASMRRSAAAAPAAAAGSLSPLSASTPGQAARSGSSSSRAGTFTGIRRRMATACGWLNSMGCSSTPSSPS
eukprot:3246555-Pyramimonas_sp.AAC.1